ncbi:hypothetical protein TeGR_g11711 [Tetraparma gracilis]|uniref:Uncharacterized protein n=1 Tax=Tetraparma gracilis TaxID=2962635 RepID=A0ABQ6MJ79_9STRA|nr:hypothetical protein TeGR_g11711 [Tetraparma gracilis]
MPKSPKKESGSPMMTRFVDEVEPWWDENHSPGTFPSRTRGVNGAFPDVHYTCVKSTTKAKNVLVIIPGWNESYIKYKENFYDLCSKKYLAGTCDIWMMDHCSQGLSGRWGPNHKRGWTTDFQNYVRDIDYFVKEVVFAGKGKGSKVSDKDTTDVPKASENETSSCQERLDLWNRTRKANETVCSGGVTWGWLWTSEWNRIDENTLTSEMVANLNQTKIQLMCCEGETICANSNMKTFAGGVKECDLVMVGGSRHEAFMEFDPQRDFFWGECVKFWQGKKDKDRKGAVEWTAKPAKFLALKNLAILALVVYVWWFFASRILAMLGLL